MFLKHHAFHHIFIITMFHAFRCVFTLLQCYVLVGLDWVEPMMFLSLHITCSCIFMHTFLQFVIFFYIILLVLFWLSLSLPLSLSCVSLHYGTQTQIHSILESFSFWCIHFFFLWPHSISRSIPWSYRSFTPTCTESTLLYLISSLTFEVRTE